MLIRTSFSFFCAMASDMPRTAVEIGVNEGHNAVSMLVSYPKLTLYAVDHYKDMFLVWDGSDEFPEERKQLHKDKAFKILNTFNNNGNKRCHIVYKSSMEAVNDFPDNHFDYIYIDGDHRYEAVKDDLEKWYPKLKIGGVFAGHDFVAECEGVVLAVQEFYNKRNLKYIIGNDGDFWHVKEWL